MLLSPPILFYMNVFQVFKMTIIISVSFLFSSFLFSAIVIVFNIMSLLAPNSPDGRSMDRPQFVKGPNTMPALGVSENTP